MKRTALTLVTLSLFAVSLGLGNGTFDASNRFERLSSTGIHLEFNATDGDLEAVIEVVGADDGLVSLSVVSTNGRKVAQLDAPDASTLGIRSYRLESPEPKEVNLVKSAYPEGVYTFTGQTSGGTTLQGTATLSHRLPAMGSFLQPAAAATDLSIEGLKITWELAEDADSYIIELEQDGQEVAITTRLPGTVDTFAVPGGFLAPDSEYKLSIGIINRHGNMTFSETTFTTAEKP